MVFGNWTDSGKNNESRPPSYTNIRINTKQIKDLNVSSETIKLLEEKLGGKITDISLSSICSTISLMQGKQTKINKWNFIELRSFCTAR